MRIGPKKKYPWYLRLIFQWQKKSYGQELVSGQVWARRPSVYFAFSLLFKALNRKRSPIGSELNALICVLVSRINHCEFCIDLNAYRALEAGGSLDKVDALEEYQESELFSDKERAVLCYAEAVTKNQVTDVQFNVLKAYFDEDTLVELTGIIAFQNCSSKFNAALAIPAQGFCSR